MNRIYFCCAWLAMGLSPAIGAGAAAAVRRVPPITAPTNVIPPTVTVAMGDVGGKSFGQVPDPAKTRRYYIAAEPELWDFAPQGLDPVCGKPLPPPVVAQRRSGKLRYVQYTDDSFASKVFQAPRLGILGPVLRGVVGEYLAVTFLNRTARPLSMHPHGVHYDKDSEGTYHLPKPGLGAAVGPGAKFTYVWQLAEESGPLPGEPSSKGWLYHSHVAGDEEANLGLVGFLVVTDPQRARPDATPRDVDREMAALFMNFDESGLGEAEKEAAEYGSLPAGAPPAKTWAEVRELMEIGGRRSINGRIFGNLTGLEMNEGEKVRWYLFGLGSEEDFHTAHWHGLRVTEDGRRRTDVVELLPASMKVADMQADNPGSWLFHCHVAEHMLEGMFAQFVVHPKGAKGASTAPGEAFFGLRQAQQSLQIRRAEAVTDKSGAACELKLEGTVTVFQAFSVFTQGVQLQLGAQTASFKPDRTGTANAEGGAFRIKNASQYGVIYGGLMEFEATLTSAGWCKELQKLGPAGGSGRPIPVTLEMRVGAARHVASVGVTVRGR